MVGNLTVTSNSGLGEISGGIVLGGNYASSNGLGLLSLAGQATLSGDFTYAGLSASGNLAADFTWPLAIDTTTDEPSLAGVPEISGVKASDLLVTVPNLLTLEVGLIEYHNPATVAPGDPIAVMRDATLTFTDLPNDLATVAISLDAVDAYDDNGDDLIDGFGLSTSIGLADVDLTVGERTLLTLEGLTLGVDGLQIRPELDDGFSTGELVFSASGLQLLPGGVSPFVAGVTPLAALSQSGVGSIDIETGAVNLSVDVPTAIGARLTMGGWVPVQLTHIDAAFDPGGSTPDIAFGLTGFVDADHLVNKLGNAIGSPNLALSVEAYDETAQAFAATSASNPLSFGIGYVSGELRLTDTPPLKVSLQNLEIPLGDALGELTLGGYLAVGGFDGFGLPMAMPAELGARTQDSKWSAIWMSRPTAARETCRDTVTLGGALTSSNGISLLDFGRRSNALGRFGRAGALGQRHGYRTVPLAHHGGPQHGQSAVQRHSAIDGAASHGPGDRDRRRRAVQHRPNRLRSHARAGGADRDGHRRGRGVAGRVGQRKCRRHSGLGTLRRRRRRADRRRGFVAALAWRLHRTNVGLPGRTQSAAARFRCWHHA